MLRRFIGDEANRDDWEWDDFVSVRAEPDLEPYRLRLMKDVHPHLGKKDMAEQVEAILRNTIKELEDTA
jgi:hypothetical protein